MRSPSSGAWRRTYAKGDYDPWNGGWLIEHKGLSDAADAFIEAKENAGLWPNTIEVYEYVLKGIQEHAPPGVNVRDVLPDHVRSCVHAPKEVAGGEEVSNATKRHRHSHLATFFRWAIEQGWADENPVEKVNKPRKEEKKKAFFEPEDVEKVLNAIDAYRKMREDEPGPTPSDQWLKEIIVVAFGTGLRRGELLNLQWRDVDLENGRLFVRHRGDFKPKNGQERAVSLVGDVLQMLRAMHEAQNPIPNEPVFTDETGSPRARIGSRSGSRNTSARRSSRAVKTSTSTASATPRRHTLRCKATRRRLWQTYWGTRPHAWPTNTATFPPVQRSVRWRTRSARSQLGTAFPNYSQVILDSVQFPSVSRKIGETPPNRKRL